ncbi:TIGR04211 family SH3 domain-containing protein [Porticoccus sp. W117]|uniref:TIGR04211 family SH3 domain-containing protein n=1 Tax=Porticoccus sp. W117 TaxID=3054777 RepID=UPI0025982538|nr:TIGR04211 family SH3 domain-containing protein [Porticoccus sp. W117]MDM3872108.1 TIGR04211 family SH3 domain-containing protein [Porticoccus sp. W117]
MKHALIGLVLLTTCTLSLAQSAETTRYITDEFRADLRSIPSNRGKIINYLRAGTQLSVLEENDDGWSHIRTSRGTEGWLLSRYLVEQQVAKARIVGVEQRNQQLQQQSSEFKQNLQDKDAEIKQLQDQLAQLENRNTSTQRELTEIKTISANHIALNDQNQQLLTMKSELESELDSLKAMNDKLENDQRYRWFLYGALAVCLGAALAIILPQLKRKRRFSEWG